MNGIGLDKVGYEIIIIKIIIIIVIIIILFARETVQITVQQSKTWHDNQAGRLRLKLPFAKTYKY